MEKMKSNKAPASQALSDEPQDVPVPQAPSDEPQDVPVQQAVPESKNDDSVEQLEFLKLYGTPSKENTRIYTLEEIEQKKAEDEKISAEIAEQEKKLAKIAEQIRLQELNDKKKKYRKLKSKPELKYVRDGVARTFKKPSAMDDLYGRS